MFSSDESLHTGRYSLYPLFLPVCEDRTVLENVACVPELPTVAVIEVAPDTPLTVEPDTGDVTVCADVDWTEFVGVIDEICVPELPTVAVIEVAPDTPLTVEPDTGDVTVCADVDWTEFVGVIDEICVPELPTVAVIEVAPDTPLTVEPDTGDVTVWADVDWTEFVGVIDEICVPVPLEKTLDVIVAPLPCTVLDDGWPELVEPDCVGDRFVDVWEPMLGPVPVLEGIDDVAETDVAVADTAVGLDWVSMLDIVWEGDIEPVTVGAVPVPDDPEVPDTIVLDVGALPVAVDPLRGAEVALGLVPVWEDMDIALLVIPEFVAVNRVELAGWIVLEALVCSVPWLPVEANKVDVILAVFCVPLTIVWLVSEWDDGDVTADVAGEDDIMVMALGDALPLLGLVTVAPVNDEPDVICIDEPVPVRSVEDAIVAVAIDELPAAWVVPEKIDEDKPVLAACVSPLADEAWLVMVENGADAVEPVFPVPLLIVWLVTVTIDDDVCNGELAAAVDREADAMVLVIPDELPVAFVVSDRVDEAVPALVSNDVSGEEDDGWIDVADELDPVAPLVDVTSVCGDDMVLISVSWDVAMFVDGWADIVTDAVCAEVIVVMGELANCVEEIPVIIVWDALVNGIDWVVMLADVNTEVTGLVDEPATVSELREVENCEEDPVIIVGDALLEGGDWLVTLVDEGAYVPPTVVDKAAVDWATVLVNIELLATVLAVAVRAFVVDCPTLVALLVAAIVEDPAVVAGLPLLLMGLVDGIAVLGAELAIDEAEVNCDEGFVLTVEATEELTLMVVDGIDVAILVCIDVDSAAVVKWEEVAADEGNTLDVAAGVVRIEALLTIVEDDVKRVEVAAIVDVAPAVEAIAGVVRIEGLLTIVEDDVNATVVAACVDVAPAVEAIAGVVRIEVLLGIVEDDDPIVELREDGLEDAIVLGAADVIGAAVVKVEVARDDMLELTSSLWINYWGGCMRGHRRRGQCRGVTECRCGTGSWVYKQIQCECEHRVRRLVLLSWAMYSC